MSEGTWMIQDGFGGDIEPSRVSGNNIWNITTISSVSNTSFNGERA
jgi:hypothetical protein